MSDHIADRGELLALLSEAARKGRVGAMRILLTELRRDSDAQPTLAQNRLGVIDELVTKREQG